MSMTRYEAAGMIFECERCMERYVRHDDRTVNLCDDCYHAEEVISDRINGQYVYTNQEVNIGLHDCRIIAFETGDTGRVEIHQIDGVVTIDTNTPEEADKLADLLVHSVQGIDIEPKKTKTVKESMEEVAPKAMVLNEDNSLFASLVNTTRTHAEMLR